MRDRHFDKLQPDPAIQLHSYITMHKEQPSRTARKVALNILTLGEKPELANVLPPGIIDATATLLVKSGVVSTAAVRLSRSSKAVAIYKAFDWMMPGQFEAFAHRKAFCERQVREGIAEGASQILMLGAGYDTMGWRLAPELDQAQYFEIDHPATAKLKARGIKAMGARPNLHLIAEDLGKRRLVDVLRDNEAWDPTAQTMIVAEGLLMYLPPEAVRDLLRQCAAITGAGSRIVFTYVGTRADGLPDAGPWTRLVLWLLKAGGEPWFWSIRPEELASFLNENNWTIAPVASSGKCGIEFLAVAMR